MKRSNNFGPIIYYLVSIRQGMVLEKRGLWISWSHVSRSGAKTHLTTTI